MEELFMKDNFRIEMHEWGMYALYYKDIYIKSSQDFKELYSDIRNGYKWMREKDPEPVEMDAFVLAQNAAIVDCKILGKYSNGRLVIEHDGLKTLVGQRAIYPCTKENEKIAKKLNFLHGKLQEINNKGGKEIAELKTYKDLYGKPPVAADEVAARKEASMN
jgi:hypothetical protein